MPEKYEFHGRAVNPTTRANLRKGLDKIAASREAAEAAMVRAIDSIAAAREAERTREAQRQTLRNELAANRDKGLA